MASLGVVTLVMGPDMARSRDLPRRPLADFRDGFAGTHQAGDRPGTGGQSRACRARRPRSAKYRRRSSGGKSNWVTRNAVDSWRRASSSCSARAETRSRDPRFHQRRAGRSSSGNQASWRCAPSAPRWWLHYPRTAAVQRRLGAPRRSSRCRRMSAPGARKSACPGAAVGSRRSRDRTCARRRAPRLCRVWRRTRSDRSRKRLRSLGGAKVT